MPSTHQRMPSRANSAMSKDEEMSISNQSSEFQPAWAHRRRKVEGTLWVRTMDGFKRDPTRKLSVARDLGDGFNAETAAQNTAHSGLSRKLKGRHLQMIAIGGSIGTGLFVGSGKALANGGPASLLIGFVLIGIMMYCTIHALGEMAVAFPVAGSFSTYSTRFLDPAWGFAMGWNYALQWLIVLPLEVVSASITIDYWGSGISNAAWVVIFLVFAIVVNLFGVRGYAEAEFVFSIVKVTAIIGFILLGIILNIAGGPGGTYIGLTNWSHPGAFNNGFKGLCSIFVTASFAFSGTELVGLTAAETANPRKTLPTAIKQVFWRITLFYVISLLLVGLLVPYTDNRLLGAANSADPNVRASPFVIAISDAGIGGLDSVMNAIIMMAVLSVANSAIYGSSRTLAALAEQNQAPKFLAYIDKQGRPLVAIGVASVFGLLAFLAASSAQATVFSWMIALSGLSSIFTWMSINLAHIRFRKAWALKGHTLDELAFRSQPGVLGSWIGFSLNICIFVAQFWTGLWPLGWETNSSSENIQSFFQAYLAAPIVLAFYIFYKIRYKTHTVRVVDMDISTGMRDMNLGILLMNERADQREWPKWKRWYKMFC